MTATQLEVFQTIRRAQTDVQGWAKGTRANVSLAYATYLSIRKAHG